MFGVFMTFITILTLIQIVVEGSILKREVTVKDSHLTATTNEVTIYAESNFWGLRWTMAVTNCTDVPGLLYKKASSIDTHNNCVLLYSRQECEGRHIKIAPGTTGHSHLSAVNFDDTLASLKLCENNNSSNYSSNEDGKLEERP